VGIKMRNATFTWGTHKVEKKDDAAAEADKKKKEEGTKAKPKRGKKKKSVWDEDMKATDDAELSPALVNVSFELKQEQLLAVVGPVG
jgi:hypothetical protein